MATLQPNQFLTSGSKKYAFAGYPSVKIYKESTGTKWVEHLLFGDYITINDINIQDGRVKAYSRGSNGWVKVGDIQTERVLEVNFVDIGQGDGCHIVTPDDQHILVDAGEHDNMNRYLWWRFYLYNKKFPLPFKFITVISHSDKDHYHGFRDIFENKKVQISHVYHNGIVERPGDPHAFGTVVNGFVTSLVPDTATMKQIIEDPAKLKGTNSTYPKVLKAALDSNPAVDFRGVTIEDGFLDGFDSNNKINNKPFVLELLGPIPEKKNGQNALKILGDTGVSKNGHSVIIRLIYGNARILLGGDINEEAGAYIVDHLSQKGELDKLEVDVAKACHHGSHKFHYDFIKHVNALGTVISSGDEEGYSHPRPDALGALGKLGYGDKPLIFSTELARSNKEFSKNNISKLQKLFIEVGKYEAEIKQHKQDLKIAVPADKPAIEEKLEKAQKKLKETNKEINSFLTKFGMINLRTDGKKMIIAQKLEQKSAHSKWDIYKLEYKPAKKRFEMVGSD